MAHDAAHPFAIMGTKGEGNYASTIDKDTDQGLTLSPKIKSEDSDDLWGIDVNSLTHEDIQSFLGSADLNRPAGADIESFLGPLELEPETEEVQEDNSWIQALLDEPERPAKKRKLTPPPATLEPQAPVSSPSQSSLFNKFASTSSNGNPQIDYAKPQGDQKYQASTFSGETDGAASNTTAISLQHDREYSSPYKYTPSQFHTNSYGDQALLMKTSEQPEPSRKPLCQATPTQSESTTASATQESPEDNFEFEGDDGSLFGDGDVDLDESSSSACSVHENSPSRKSSTLPFAQTHTLTANTQPWRVSRLSFPKLPLPVEEAIPTTSFIIPFAESSVHTTFLQPGNPKLHLPQPPQISAARSSSTSSSFSNPKILELCLSPNGTDKSTTYPTPGFSSLEADLPMLSVERDSSPLSLNDDLMRLHDQVHRRCTIPKFTKKSFQAYAAQHGLTGGARPNLGNDSLNFGTSESGYGPKYTQKSSTTPVSSATLDTFSTTHSETPTTSSDGGSSSTPFDLTSEAPVHLLPQSPEEIFNKSLLYQRIAALLYAKLEESCTRPHMVPQDLANLFESLEKKFAEDRNFRNSVLLWTICRIKALQEKHPIMKEEPDKRVIEAYNKIESLEREKESMKKKMADMAKYIAYLEAVNRRIPHPY